MKTLWQRMLHKITQSLAALTRDRQPLPKAIEAIPPAERIPSEARLLNMFQLGKAEGLAEGYNRALAETTIKRLQAVVYIDRTQQGAYEQPSPITNPTLQRQLEAQRRQREEEQAFKQLLDVNTRQLQAIRAHPGGITRSGVAKHYVQTHVTGKLKPITLAKPTQQLDPDGFLL